MDRGIGTTARLGKKPAVGWPVTAFMTSTASSDRRTQTLLADIAVGLFAGLVATQVTNLAQGPLQWVTPDSVGRQEKRVRPGGSSSLVAARKTAYGLDRSPNRQNVELLGKAQYRSFRCLDTLYR